jgi:hypothetical protein
LFLSALIDRYNGSPTNRAIIDSYSQFIYGKGLTSTQQTMKPLLFANVLNIVGKKDLKAICHDYSLFGEASLELIYKRRVKANQTRSENKNSSSKNG